MIFIRLPGSLVGGEAERLRGCGCAEEQQ